MIAPVRRHLEMPHSDEEHLSGQTWIDGRPIYRKVVDIGPLPDTATKNVAHGVIANQFVGLGGFAVGSGIMFPLPFVASDLAANSVQVFVGAFDIIITTGSNRTPFSGYITLEYLKAV